MKTPPHRSIILISSGKIFKPLTDLNCTTPKLHLHHTLQMAMRHGYLFAWSTHRFHPSPTITTYSTSLFSSNKPNEQSNVVANTASTPSISVHKLQHEWPTRIKLSVTQWSPFMNSLLSSDAIYSSNDSIIQLIMLIMMMVMARAMPMAMMMATLQLQVTALWWRRRWYSHVDGYGLDCPVVPHDFYLLRTMFKNW